MNESVLQWYKRLTAAQWGKGREVAARRAGIPYRAIHGAAGHHRRAEHVLRVALRSRVKKGRTKIAEHEARQAHAKRARAMGWRAQP